MQKINSQEELEKELVKHAKKLPGLIPKCTNEAQTKISLINPYLELLGWDVRNPDIVRQEYHADIKTKNPERVDYAILKEGRVLILIEAKSVEKTLTSEAVHQIRRYFQTKKSSYGIMTNGVVWEWYQQDPAPAPDEKPGQLAKRPFLIHRADHLPNQEILLWLWNIHPDRFDEKTLKHTAWQFDAQALVQKWFEQNRQEPEKDFIKLLIKRTGACKAATSSAVDNMKEPVRNALNQMMIRDRINLSLDQARPEPRGMQNRDTPSAPVAAPMPAAVPEAPKPEPLENPYIPNWIPITEWKKFHFPRVPGQGKPKVKMTLRFPGSVDRECTGFSNLARAVIDWMDNRFISEPISESRLIRIPGKTMVFANTEPAHNTGRKFLRIYHAKNLGMYFEFNLNTENLMPSVIALLERFRIDPQQVIIRSSRESK